LLLSASLALVNVFGAAAFAQPPQQVASTQVSPATNEAVQVVNAFMGALVSGQLDTARRLMTPDAVVIANGSVLGARDAYIDGAAKADAAALKNVQRELIRRDARIGAAADLALVLSEKRLRALGSTQGPSEVVVETMLLAKTPAGWKITHIHWSGRHG
jgi:ketosteroid isomerase-like protein